MECKMFFCFLPPNLHLNLSDAVYVAFLLLQPKLEWIQICQIMKSTFLSRSTFTFCQMMHQINISRNTQRGCKKKKDNVRKNVATYAKRCPIQLPSTYKLRWNDRKGPFDTDSLLALMSKVFFSGLLLCKWWFYGINLTYRRKFGPRRGEKLQRAILGRGGGRGKHYTARNRRAIGPHIKGPQIQLQHYTIG